MVKSFKEFIGESVWSDIHKRSNGLQARKEDDIDSLGPEMFRDYLSDNYTMKGKYKFVLYTYPSNKLLELPIMCYKGNVDAEIVIFVQYNNDRIIGFSIDDYGLFDESCDILKLSELLGDGFSVKKAPRKNSRWGEIRLSDGEYMTNTQVVEVIDALIAAAKYPILRKSD